MFIVNSIKVVNATGELKLLYQKIEKTLGFVPPHFELFATIDKESLKDFIEYNLYFSKHPKIDAKILPFLRLCIAQKECRKYCVDFNTKLLMENGVNKQILSDICLNIDKLSFDVKQKLLLSKVIYAIYNADKFSKEDLQELYDVDFSDKDFYELLSYATNFMAKSKLIEVYIK
jgi:alkylhydroperoxidase family enzyme